MEQIGLLSREQLGREQLGRNLLGMRHDVQLPSQRPDAGFARFEGAFERTRAETRADLAELRAGLKADLAELRAEPKADRADLRAETNAGLALQTPQLGLWSIGALAGVAGVVLAAAQLPPS